MNQSIKDEPHISAREFSILKDIVKRLPDRNAKASLETATISYEEALQARGIDVKSDKVYFGALLRLNHYDGLTWREKLLNAASKVEAEYKSQAGTREQSHRRYRSDTSSLNPRAQKNEDNRQPFVQQRTDRDQNPLRRSQPPRLNFNVNHAVVEECVPSLTGEATYALVQKFKLFQRTQSRKILHRVFMHWLGVARAVQDIRREQLEFAINEDHHTLKLQAFEIWLRSYQARVKHYQEQARKADLRVLHKCYRRWESLVIERRQEQYVAKVAAEKEALYRALMNKNQKKLIARKLQHWRNRLRTIRQAESKALILRDKRMQVVVWKTWFFKTCEVRTAQCYLNAIKVRMFRLWASKHRHLRILEQRADTKRDEDLLTSAWDNWRLSFAAREQALEVAVNYHSNKLLRSSLSLWSHAFKIAYRSDKIQDMVENRLIRSSWISWLTAFRHKQRLYEAAKAKRSRHLFQAWRREAKAGALLYSMDTTILRTCFKKWRVEYRGKVFFGTLQDRTVASFFHRWQTKCSALQTRLRVAENEITSKRDDQVLSRSIGHWLHRLDLLHLKESMADQRYDRTILLFVFAKFRGVCDEQRFQRTRADTFAVKTSNRRVFRAWRSALEQKKERDRDVKLNALLLRKDNTLVASSFGLWKRRASHYTQVATEAELMSKARDKNQVHYFFTAWCDRHFDIFEMERVARDQESQNAATLLLRSLVEKYRSRLATLNLADQIWNEKVEHSAWQQLMHWRARYRRIEEQNRHADFLRNDTFSKRFMRRVLRTWSIKRRDRARSRGDETSYGELSASRSGSFDASRTRVPWNESRSFRQNRSLLQ